MKEKGNASIAVRLILFFLMEEEARTIYVQEVTQLHVKNGLPAETLLSKTGKRSCQVSSVFLYPHKAECKTAAKPHIHASEIMLHHFSNHLQASRHMKQVL